jgi:Rad52/22 family double-strand break repair protein
MTGKTQEKSQGSGRLAALGSAAVVAQPEHSGAPGNPLTDDVYQQLAAPFDSTFRDQRGGVDLEYITGEQCVSRLNQVLGPAGWSFTVREHGLNAEADEVWVLGELTLVLDGQTAVRQQFGSQRVKRNRTSGTPLDVGFDLKGAATDALKKCASLIGVGLYLSRKEPAPTEAASGDGDRGERLCCESCQQELGEIRFRDGTAWMPAQLASLGRRKHGRVLCMDHYRQANEARRRAEQGPQDLAF